MSDITEVLAKRERLQLLDNERMLLDLVGSEVEVLTRYHWKDPTGMLMSYGAQSGEYQWMVGRLCFTTAQVVTITLWAGAKNTARKKETPSIVVRL